MIEKLPEFHFFKPYNINCFSELLDYCNYILSI